MQINKKAQSMSMNVIIVAVLALIVLVVLLFIFSSKLNIFGKGVSSCQGTCTDGTKDNGYTVCSNLNKDDNPIKFTYNPSSDCGTTKVCCMKVTQ